MAEHRMPALARERIEHERTRSAAAAEIARLKAELAAARSETRQLADSEQSAREKAASLTSEVRKLRSELHASELRHAELQGYCKAISDTEPPRMVPEPREQHISRLLREPSINLMRGYASSAGGETPWWNRNHG